MQLLPWFNKAGHEATGVSRVKALKNQQRKKMHPKQRKIVDRSGKTSHFKCKV